MPKSNKVGVSNGLPSGQKEPPRPAVIKIRPSVKVEPTPVKADLKPEREPEHDAPEADLEKVAVRRTMETRPVRRPIHRRQDS